MADHSPGDGNAQPLRAGIVALLLAAFAAWAWWAATVAYDFANPTARAWLASEAPSYGLLVSGLPAGGLVVAAALTFLASALGFGHVALRPLRLRWFGLGERALLELVVGLQVWTWLTLALGSAGLLRQGVFLGVLAVGLAVGAAGWLRLLPSTRRGADARAGPPLPAVTVSLRLVLGTAVALLVAVFLYLALLGALGPEVQFDGRWYHLAQVKHYLQRGRLYNMVAETRMGVVGLPAYHQMLLTGAGAAFGLRVAKLLPWFEGLIAVLGLVAVGWHHFRSRLVGLVAALVLVSTPLVGWFMATSANDLMVVLLCLFSTHAYLRWRLEPARQGWLVVVGATGGFALGVKPFALASLAALLLGVAFDGWRSAAGRRLLAAATGVLVVAGVALAAVTPWLIRSYVTTGNPTFPFLDGVVFDSPYWSSVVESHYRAAIRSYGVEPSLGWFLRLPLRLVTRADNHRGLVGPVFLLFAPVLALVVATARGAAGGLVRRLAAYSGLVLALWFAGGLHESRYVAFVLPPVALLVAHAVVDHAWGGRLGRALRAALAVAGVAAAVLNLHPFAPFQVHGTTVACRPFIPWGYLYRGVPEESYTSASLAMVSYLNRHLRAGVDKVYDGAKSQLVYYYLYCDVELFNGEGWEGPCGMGEWDLLSPDAPRRLEQAGVTHVVARSRRWPERRLRESPLWPALEEVWRAPDGKVLYRFDPTRVRS